MNRSRDRSQTVPSPSTTQPKGTIDQAVLSLVPSVLRCHISQRPEIDRPMDNGKILKTVDDPSCCESKSLLSKSPKVSTLSAHATPYEKPSTLLPTSLIPETSSIDPYSLFLENSSLVPETVSVDPYSLFLETKWTVSSYTGQPAPLKDRSTAVSEYFSSKQKVDDAQAEKEMRWARIQEYAKQRQSLVKKMFEETDPDQTALLTNKLSSICKAQQLEESAYRLCIETLQDAKNRHSYAKLRYKDICIQSDGYLPNVTTCSDPFSASFMVEEPFLPWKPNDWHYTPLRAALETIWAPNNNICTSPPRAAFKAPTLTSITCTPTKSILRSSTSSTPSKESSRSRVGFTPASEVKTKYFVPPLEAAGIKDPMDRVKLNAGNRCHHRHKSGPITAYTLYNWSQSKEVRDTTRFASFLGSASLEEVARAFYYGELPDVALNGAITLLYVGGFLDNPECPASTMLYLEASSESQKRAHLKQLIGLLPSQN